MFLKEAKGFKRGATIAAAGMFLRESKAILLDPFLYFQNEYILNEEAITHFKYQEEQLLSLVPPLEKPMIY